MLPLATDEIRKLNAFKLFLKMNAINAFWFIPLDEECSSRWMKSRRNPWRFKCMKAY
jgi:hypothetical protein